MTDDETKIEKKPGKKGWFSRLMRGSDEQPGAPETDLEQLEIKPGYPPEVALESVPEVEFEESHAAEEPLPEAVAPTEPIELAPEVTFQPEKGEGTVQAERRGRWLARLSQGLSRSSAKLTGGITDLFNKRKLDDEALEELEELLISADLGVATAARLSRALAKTRFNQQVTPEEVRTALAEEVAKVLEPVAQTISINEAHKPHVILVCGVNGSGKTTTIAKFAHLFKRVGFNVVLAAGDTFRAAAIEQLQIWGERAGCSVISRPPGSDAAGLAYDALEKARAQRADVLLIDTAGRLQNKSHLMAELQKIQRVVKKLDESAPHDCILVLDATIGQNAHSQVEVFRDMVNVTGLVVTKVDGSAKGGVVVALAEKFGLPVYAVGVGESLEDMRAFEAHVFARTLLGLEA